MKRSPILRLLLGLAVLAGTAARGHAINRYRPFVVQVRNAETHQPIANAAVRITYPLAGVLLPPSPSEGDTDAEGLVRLKAAPYGDFGILVEAAAHGHMQEDRRVTVKELEAVPTAHMFESIEKRKPNLILELYAHPRPTIDLVLPDSFHGELKVSIQATDERLKTPGQRNFRFVVVVGSKEVQAVGPSIFKHVAPEDVNAQDAQGNPLTWHAKGADRGFWWVRTDGRNEFFFVGTREEYEANHPGRRGAEGDPRPAGGHGGGGRRHGDH